MPPVIAAVGAAWVALGAITVAGVSLTTIIATIAIDVALIAISSLFAPGAPKQPSPHASRENYRNPIAARPKCIGRVKIGGILK
jgi:hypothetical protein